MRTTLDIADDVLRAAKERARRENKTAGQVVSELLRQALTAPAVSAVRAAKPVHGPRQLTDAYLLALAVQHGGRLVTCDAGIPRAAVIGAMPRHMVVL